MSAENTGCLDGLRCPKCGSLGPLHIEVKAVVVMHDDGWDTGYDSEWQDDSWCKCDGCDFTGTIKDFKIEEK